MALEAFRRIQIGKEATRGTSVAATKKLIGNLTLTPEITWHRPADERNSLAEFRRAVIAAQGAKLRYEASATYEQLIYFLAMGLRGDGSAAWSNPTTPVGGTNSRLWTFTPLLTARNQQNAYTFEYGDETQEFESAFCMAENLELSVVLNDVVKLTADLFAEFPAKSSFTGALSDIAVNEIVANKLNLWIDGTWANLGVTAKDTLLAGATIKFPTGLVPIKYADGSLENVSAFMEQRRHFEIDMDLAVSTAGITEYDAAVAAGGTSRAIRMKFTGPIIEAALTYYLQVDMFGKYTNVPEIFGARDGENLLSVNFASHEDSLGNESSVLVQNIETALA